MGNKACDHIKPCNIGTSEQHNRREPEYVKAWKDKKGNYIRHDLTSRNDSWVSGQMEGRDLQAYYDDIGKMVKEKTGRAMQTKARERVDKKTGKRKAVNGSSPLRESSVNIKPGTTMEDLRRYVDACHKRWGITAIQIHIHRDEGHYENVNDPSTWKPNLHAHIIWDWMDHKTGKSRKLNKKDMSDLQDYAAACLGMERGKSKAETGAEHLERNDYILASQQKKMAANEERIAEQEKEIGEKQAESDALDKERAEKRQKLDEESGSKLRSAAANIGNGVANLLGFGDLHDANEEVKRLADENKALKDSVPGKIEELKRSFKSQVDAAAEKRAAPLNEKIAEQQGQINLLNLQKNELMSKKAEAEDNISMQKEQYEKRIRWRDIILYRLGRMLYDSSALFKKAVDLILEFFRSPFDVFDGAQAKVIKDGIDSVAKTNEERVATGNLLVGVAEGISKAKVSDKRLDVAYDQVEQVAKGDYDWKIARTGQGVSR